MIQMCPDRAPKSVKGLLEIKEDCPACGFDVEENLETVSVKTESIAFEARRDSWKHSVYDKAGEVVLEENVRDLDAHMNYSSLPIGFTTRGEKFLRSNETFNLTPGESFFGFGEDVPPDAHFYNGRSGLEMHNIYTLLYQKASFEAIEEGTGHRGLLNARSGTAGMQRFPICWSGDPNCEWEDMLNDMRAGLNIGLSGVPFWNCNNGGYCEAIGARAQARVVDALDPVDDVPVACAPT